MALPFLLRSIGWHQPAKGRISAPPTSEQAVLKLRRDLVARAMAAGAIAPNPARTALKRHRLSAVIRAIAS